MCDNRLLLLCLALFKRKLDIWSGIYYLFVYLWGETLLYLSGSCGNIKKRWKYFCFCLAQERHSMLGVVSKTWVGFITRYTFICTCNLMGRINGSVWVALNWSVCTGLRANFLLSETPWSVFTETFLEDGFQRANVLCHSYWSVYREDSTSSPCVAKPIPANWQQYWLTRVGKWQWTGICLMPWLSLG